MKSSGFLHLDVFPADRGRKLKVHKTFRRRSCVRSIYVLSARLAPIRRNIGNLTWEPKYSTFSSGVIVK